MGLTYGGPADKLTWGFSDMGASSDPSSLKFCELILTPQIPSFFHCQESWRSIEWKKGKCFLADFFACHLCLEWWKLLSYQMIWGGYFLSLPWLLSTTSRDVLAELVDLIYGGLLKTTFSCVFVFSSVCATRQAFRLRRRSICISEGSRCSIINSNLEGKEKVKKGQIPYPTSGGFVLLLSLSEAPECFMCLEPLHQRLQANMKEAATRGVSYGSIDTANLSCCHGRNPIVRRRGRRDLQRS